jgi:hypothetical protein
LETITKANTSFGRITILIGSQSYICHFSTLGGGVTTPKKSTFPYEFPELESQFIFFDFFRLFENVLVYGHSMNLLKGKMG